MERLFTSVQQFYETDSVKTRKALRNPWLSLAGPNPAISRTMRSSQKLDQYIRKGNNRQTVLDDLRAFKKYLDRKDIVKHIDGKEVITQYAIKSKMLHIAVVQSWLSKNEIESCGVQPGFSYKEKPDFNDQAFLRTRKKCNMLTTPVSKCLFIFCYPPVAESTRLRT